MMPEEKEIRDFSHMITLTVGVKDPNDWDYIYDSFGRTARELGPQYPYVSVSSSQTDDLENIEELYHDDMTLQKVYDALLPCVADSNRAKEVINELQNAGILFRERTRD